jgi:hypothetical protein
MKDTVLVMNDVATANGPDQRVAIWTKQIAEPVNARDCVVVRERHDIPCCMSTTRLECGDLSRLFDNALLDCSRYRREDLCRRVVFASPYDDNLVRCWT